jgi:hypothetical protein
VVTSPFEFVMTVADAGGKMVLNSPSELVVTVGTRLVADVVSTGGA